MASVHILNINKKENVLRVAHTNYRSFEHNNSNKIAVILRFTKKENAKKTINEIEPNNGKYSCSA